MKFYSVALAEKKQETKDTSTFTFEIPDQLKDGFAFKSGQYITVKFNINGKEERRSYSLCSSPHEGKWTIAVKKIENGLVSVYMVDQLQAGSMVEVSTPEGKFYVSPDSSRQKSYYLFAAGSGITPIMSILKTILEEEPKSNVFLLYGNRNEQSIIFQNELDKIEKRFAGQFFLEYTLSRPNNSGQPNTQTGRIDTEKVASFLEKQSDNTQNEYYICGPTQMIQSIESFLLQKEVTKKQIHFEYFTPPETQDNDNPDNQTPIETAAKITLDGVKIVIQIPKGTNIVDALVEEGYDPPYSCKSGTCSTCIAKLIKGKVIMETHIGLDDDELQEGYILACQAQATTREIELTFEV